MRTAQQLLGTLALMVAFVVPQFVGAAEGPATVGSVSITNPGIEETLWGVNNFAASFTDENSSTTNAAEWTITAGACGDGETITSGTFSDSDDLTVDVDLTGWAPDVYCFTVTVNAADETETEASAARNFEVTTTSDVEITEPEGAVNGVVPFRATVSFGMPELSDELEWSVFTGSCESEDEETQVAGNTNGFTDAFTYGDGSFNADVDTTDWEQGTYCLVVDPQEGEGDSVSATRQFSVRLNTVGGQKYEDVDGNGLLNYEIDRLVADMPIIATNEETGAVVETVTDAEGSYEFVLPNGVWTISEGEKSGWEEIRAYYGYILIDEGEDEMIPMDCSFELSTMSERRMKGIACTFLNKQVAETKSHSGGTRIRRDVVPAGQVLGASTSTVALCNGMYITSYMRLGMQNPTDQVTKLQVFLNAIGFTTAITGTFDTATDKSVRAFQEKYLSSILTPWKIVTGTGYVFKTTRATINSMVCPGSEPAPTL